jgi:serine/threonine-protein kinase RsbW
MAVEKSGESRSVEGEADVEADRSPAESRRFDRHIGSLPAIVAFTADVFGRHGIASELLPAVDFAIEELFTNMLKYTGGSMAPIEISIRAIVGGTEVVLIDRDVAPFDVTQAPDVDVTLPLERRVPGGLGLHLTRRLVDSIEYSYTPERRESRIVLRKYSTAATAVSMGRDDERC